MLNSIVGLLGTGVTTPVSTNSYESISTVTVGSTPQSSVSFTSIPSTYTHLQIRYMIPASSLQYDLKMQYNSDTGSTQYTRHYLYGDGSSVAAGYTNQEFTSIGYPFTSNSQPYIGIVDILDYANTNKYKVHRSLSGVDQNGSGSVIMFSGLWKSTSAISTITLTAAANSFQQYSHFALYGIKGA